MQAHSNAGAWPRRLAFGMTLAAALATTACSASGGAAPPAKSTHSTAAGGATPVASGPATTATSGLSGRWSGHYGGSYKGTFILHWRQSGSRLSGTIRLSTLSGALPIHGTVTGGAIRFGTVGSMAITYSGTVSGSSMSGSYRIKNGAGAGGSWSATKS